MGNFCIKVQILWEKSPEEFSLPVQSIAIPGTWGTLHFIAKVLGHNNAITVKQTKAYTPIFIFLMCCSRMELFIIKNSQSRNSCHYVFLGYYLSMNDFCHEMENYPVLIVLHAFLYKCAWLNWPKGLTWPGNPSSVRSENQSLVYLEAYKPRVDESLAARDHCCDLERMRCIQNFGCKSS